MFRVIKASAILSLVGLLSGCITHSASLVSDPLQPASGEPVAYLVGSIGPVSFKLSPAENQRLLIRKRGSAHGAAGLWMRGGHQTPQDIEDGDGAIAVRQQRALPDSTLADSQDYQQPIHVMVDAPLQSSTLRNHLRETGVLRNIETGSGKADEYSVQVKLKMQREYPPFPVVLLSCTSLFMLPLSKEIDTDTECTVLRGDQRPKQYRYRNSTRKYTWLLDQGGEMEGQNLSRIARAFTRDVRQDQLIPAVGAAQ